MIVIERQRPSVVVIDPGPSVAYIEPRPLIRLSPTPLPRNPYCREYQSRVTVGGRFEEGYRIACLGPDGAWRFVR